MPIARVAQRSTLDLLLAGQKEALELALSRAPLDEVLAVLIRTARHQAGESAFGAAIFILQPDGVHLRAGIASQVPETYVRAVEEFPVGEDAPPCQTAVLTGKPVIIEDLTRNPVWTKRDNGDALWQNYFRAVERFGVRSCWCHPIRTSDDRMLGAFVV